MACQAQKHYDKLHEYCLQLWEIIKERYKNFDKVSLLFLIHVLFEDEALRKIKEFFLEVVAKAKDLSNQYLNPQSSSRQEEMIQGEAATPLPTPEPLSEDRSLQVD